jgi:KDO2-lipid IV(A) lauroyltransferase
LASLGKVCATGIAGAAVSGIFFLPLWWRAAGGATWSHSEESLSRPSTLYRARWWKLALTVARVLPRSWLQVLGVAGATLYRWWNPARLEVVRANLRPVVDSDAAADRAARRLFSEFGRKLADLWRSEAGMDIAPLVRPVSGWEIFGEALARGRGVLLVTPHLGNWEFGAPLVTRRNVPLNVITLTEPGDGFTQLRESARHRAGITTHVIGENPFAFVEIIKRLQAGEVVALLMDRPPATSAVRVEFCGHPFDASIAVAELARATGAAILPVAICRSGAEYTAEVFPEITYDRATLNSREARRELTGQILRAFEPAIRKHPEQWFHFVPIWPS